MAAYPIRVRPKGKPIPNPLDEVTGHPYMLGRKHPRPTNQELSVVPVTIKRRRLKLPPGAGGGNA